MSNTDLPEWRLYQTDLTTQLAILPFVSSHILARNNEPGSGEVSIKLDAPIAASVTFGQYVQLFYRGSARVGFFIDTLNQTDADGNEGTGRMLSMSGQGALSLLSRSIVQASNNTDTTRTFTAVTKASILITLIAEAQARGELAQLAYDFSASVDSAAIAWTDSETYDLAVGTTLLDVAKQFAETGSFDFKITFAAGVFTLGAYSAGRGSNKATTTYLRIGTNCEEVTQDRRGEEIYNVYYVKWKEGYVTVSDATSISTYGRRVKFLSLEQAQSSASATTYASAQLALTKDPKNNKTVKVYDGVAPRLWEDYDLGDTISLDRFGTVSADKILGIQADFDGTEFSHVTLDFNVIHYDSDLRMQDDLNWLLDQWSTAHDGDLLEVSQGMSIGGTNGMVNTIHKYGDYVYIGGGFTLVGSLASSYTARYQLSTHSWTALTGISASVTKIINVAGTIYACTATKVYVLSGTAWSLVGTVGGSDLIFCMATDGISLFVGGAIVLMDAVTIQGQVAMRTAGVWSNPITTSIAPYYILSMEWYNGALHAGFAGSSVGNGALRYASSLSGGFWISIKGGTTPNVSGKYIYALKNVGSNLILASCDALGGPTTCRIYLWDGVNIGFGSELQLLGTISDFTPVNNGIGSGSCEINCYLTDIYFGADFDTIDSVTGYAGIAKYSGGLWSTVGGGVSTAAGDGVTTIELVNTDVYAGGIFTTAFGINTIDLSLFVTDFQSMLDHALNDYGGIDHEHLAGLLGGTTSQHYHLTSSEYTGTGTGDFVRKTSPTLVTPVLGVATATSINKVAITAPATSATLTIADGKTLTVNDTGIAALLDVVQTFSVGKRFDAGIGLSTAAVTNAEINISKTFTDTSGAVLGISAAVLNNPAGASSANVTGGQFTARSTSGNVQNFTGTFTGGLYNVIHQGTATMNTAKAGSFQVLVNNSGTITDAIGNDILAFSVTGGGAITNAYGLRIGNITAGGTLNFAISTGTGLVHFGDSVDLASRKNLTITAAAIITDTTTGLQIGTGTTQKLGFYNNTPIVRGTAFTQTYSTAATTITQTAMTDPAAYGAGANGYSTGAMAQAIHAEVIALKANMVVTQNVLNGVIDQLQALGLFG